MDKYENPTRVPKSTFSALSSDLKLEIFDFVRSKCDQGNARLVSREWNRLMRPRMWRDFTTSLRGTFTEDLYNLPEEQYACFYDIRTLAVGGGHVGPDYNARFSSFMHLLRDDQLLEFSSPQETPLNSMQLLSLLRHQSNLRSFRARLDWSHTAIEDIASWTTEQTSLFTSALHSLRTLRIYVGDPTEGDHALQDCAMACNDFLIKAAPLLNCLEICGWRQIWYNRVDRIPLTAFFGNTANPKHIPRTLRHLILADMDLSGAENKLTRTVDFAALCSLKIEYCDKVVPFIFTLATSIRHTRVQLKFLTVRTREYAIPGNNDYIDKAVKDLLCSFAGLEELELDFSSCAFLDWKASLGTHQTLKKLLVSSAVLANGDPYSTEKMAHILEQCPNVQYFAFRPTFFSIGYVADCRPLSSLHSRFYELLDIVAAARAIRTLRMLYAPGLEEDSVNRHNPDWVEKASKIAHRFATLVLTHLYLKGSNVSLLALSPNTRWKQVRGDSNLHYYPHYFYRLQIVDLGGKMVIEAAPLWDYVAECPDAAIFV